MKKVIILMTVIATAFGCKKEMQSSGGAQNTSVNSILKKDTSLSDKTIQVPKTTELLASFVFDVGNADGLVATGAKVVFQASGAFSPSEDLKNLAFVIKDGASVIFTSEIKSSVVNSANSFDQFAKQLVKTKSYTIEIYADILVSAADNVSPLDECITNFELIFSHKGENQTSRNSTSQKVTFSLTAPPLIITTSLGSANPIGSTILEGQEKTNLVYTVIPTGSAAFIKEHKFKIEGQAASAVQSLKLYDGATLLVNAPVVGGSVIILTNVFALENLQKVFTVKAVVSGIYSDISGYDFNIVLDEISAISATTINAAINYIDRTSNNFTVFKTLPLVEKITVAPLSITNNSAMELYRFKVTAQNSPLAQKQFAFDINLNDQATNDTLFLKNFKIFEDNVDVTSQYRFTDAIGTVDTMITESDTKLYCTRISGTGETVINSGSSKIFSFRATIGGFNRIGEGDGFSISMPSDNNHLVNQKYLNSGGINGNAKLHSSASASSGAQNANYICTDISAVSHSGQLGLSSNDWFNGNKVFSGLPANIFFH